MADEHHRPRPPDHRPTIVKPTTDTAPPLRQTEPDGRRLPSRQPAALCGKSSTGSAEPSSRPSSLPSHPFLAQAVSPNGAGPVGDTPAFGCRVHDAGPTTPNRTNMTMTTIAIVGAGAGLGSAVARRFGAEGFAVALLSRRQEHVDALAADLAADGLSRPWLRRRRTRSGGADRRAADGPPTTWARSRCCSTVPSPRPRSCARSSTPPWTDLTGAIEFSVYGPVTAVHQVLPGMRQLGRGTVLFVNGGSGARPNPKVAGTSIAFAGEGAYASMLHTALAAENVHVGQLIIPGGITPGHPTHDPDVLAERLWIMHTSRDVFRVFAEPMDL